MRNKALVANLVIAVVGLTLFAIVNLLSGRVEANDGLGWDGRQYAHMVTDRVVDGTASTQTRPLLPLLTRIPFTAGLDIIPAFQFMNAVYAVVLYFFLCILLDLHGVATPYKAYFIVTVALCISTSRMFAFYPTLIDLGAIAALSAATYVLLTRTGWAAGAAAAVAVTTREFGAVLALVGFHRGVRLGGGILRPLLTFAPAVGVLFVLRYWADATNLGDRDRGVATVTEMLAGLSVWRDPPFVVFFAYFLVTLLGGVTVLLVLRPVWCIRALASVPELATWCAFVVGAAAIGIDIWRYLVFMLPAIAILYALYVCEHRPGLALLTTAFILTLATQQPFAEMDMADYFREWFPGYVYRTDDATPAFWTSWRVRIALTVAGALTLGIMQRAMRHPRPRERTREQTL